MVEIKISCDICGHSETVEACCKDATVDVLNNYIMNSVIPRTDAENGNFYMFKFNGEFKEVMDGEDAIRHSTKTVHICKDCVNKFKLV